MSTYRIAVIAGDGIGKEVVPAALQVLTLAAQQDGFALDLTELPWGCDYYLSTGRMMDPDGMTIKAVAGRMFGETNVA
jgi:tartrate dehydrogenase/decarboxylase / D-malate dehydrogenase